MNAALGPVMRDRWTAVDRYLMDLLVPSDASLDAALRANAAAGLPLHDISPNEGRLLQLLARAQGARAILEIGTLGGYSTIWLARALPTDGRLVTLEADPKHAGVAGPTSRAPASAAWWSCVWAARWTRCRGPFDLIFIDADKQHNPDYLARALKLSRRGSLIIADNIVRGGAVVDSATEDPSVQGVRRFIEMLAAEPRCSAAAIQTVGSKGYDGFVIALVTADA